MKENEFEIRFKTTDSSSIDDMQVTLTTIKWLRKIISRSPNAYYETTYNDFPTVGQKVLVIILYKSVNVYL